MKIPWIINESNASDLVKRVYSSMCRDYGYKVAAYFGRVLEDMTDDEALAWAEVGKKMNWDGTCSACGNPSSCHQKS